MNQAAGEDSHLTMLILPDTPVYGDRLIHGGVRLASSVSSIDIWYCLCIGCLTCCICVNFAERWIERQEGECFQGRCHREVSCQDKKLLKPFSYLHTQQEENLFKKDVNKKVRVYMMGVISTSVFTVATLQTDCAQLPTSPFAVLTPAAAAAARLRKKRRIKSPLAKMISRR